MPSKYPLDELRARYRTLPPVLQDALFSEETANKLVDIGQRHGCTVEQIGIMAEETGYTILGLVSPRDFARVLKTELGVDEETAFAIARDISHQVFFAIRESLKKTHEFEVGDDAMKPAPEDSRRPPATKPVRPSIVPGLEQKPAAQPIRPPMSMPPPRPPQPPAPTPVPSAPKPAPITPPVRPAPLPPISVPPPPTPSSAPPPQFQKAAPQTPKPTHPPAPQTPPKPAMSLIPPPQTSPKKIPPIDLRIPPKPPENLPISRKIYQGSDPYKEPVE